jgi:pSer/pThr/pTyr-binding forkhead associated (FHA) protein
MRKRNSLAPADCHFEQILDLQSVFFRKTVNMQVFRTIIEEIGASTILRAKAMFCVLRVIDGPAHGSHVFLSSNQRLVIGRLSSADFSIPTDQHLSRNHLLVESDEMSFRVRDMGSSNGTFVNNAPISEVEIFSGDIIRAGKTVFEVQLKREAKPSNLAISKDSVAPKSDAIPSRTLNTEWDNDLTKRHSLSQNIGKLTLPLGVDFIEQLAELISTFSNNSINSNLFERTLALGALDSQSLFDCLGMFHASLYFAINPKQVSSKDFSALDINPKLVRKLSDSHVVIEHPSLFETLQLLQECYQRETFVAIASRSPIPWTWFENWKNQICCPSMLARNIESDPSTSIQITRGVDWLLFEPDRSGRLAILLNENTRRELNQSIKKPAY